MFTADVNWLALSIFGLFLAVTLAVTYWATRRTRTATEFWAAGRGITGPQNGFAIAGDYMSGASLLGTVGLIFLFGFDGIVYMVGFLVAFLTVLFLLAERMRNAGKFTIADVLAFRLRQGPARSAAALSTLCVACAYLVTQMTGAGALIQVLVGVDYAAAVVLTGTIMMIYVIFGGMIATTWLQIIKAVLLLSAGLLLSVLVLSRVGFNPVELFDRAAAASPHGEAYLGPGLFLKDPISTVSLGLALVLGTAGLPHVLMRFFTVPEAKAARSSVGWAVVLIGAFYLMTTIMGFGARAILGTAGEGPAGEGGNLAAPLLAESLGGGAGTFGGDLFLAVIAAVTFATILAVVAGLVISASGAMAHDIWTNVVRGGRGSGREEVRVARLSAALIGALSIGVAILAEGQNISFLVGLVFAMAASANFPALLLALMWRRLNTAGAVAGVLVGVASSIVLIVLSPTVWPNPEDAPFPLTNPALVSVPLGFLGCYLGTVLSKERAAERSFDELYVRSETGLGAEAATPPAH
jgi:cation/acetate symporter